MRDAACGKRMLRATRETSMATGTSKWQRRIMATGVAATAVLMPLVPATPANAASLCAPPADTVPPQISSVTFSRQSVDLTTGPRTVTVTADATDSSGNGAASGVKRISVFLTGPRADADARLSLSSGSAADGVWTGKLTIPKNARAGTFTLRQVTAQDAAGNFQAYSNDDSHADSPTDISVQPGWDTTITATGTGTPPPKPVKAGTLTAFNFTPRAVNTTHAAKTVHVTATFSAPRPTRIFLFFARTSGKGHSFFQEKVPFTHTTGGHWAGHFLVHRWLGDSKARPQFFADFGANVKPRFRNLSESTLHALHAPTVLTITSGVDRTKPVLKTLSFSPSSVNTVSGAQTVTVTATASDALSGVAQIQTSLSIRNGDSEGAPAGGLYPYPGVGFEQSGYVNVSLKPSGNKWIGTATFRKCVPSGNWQVRTYVSDRAGNNAGYSTKKLDAAGLPGTLSVTSTPGDVEPPSVRDATAAGAAHSITLDFTEGVKNVNTSTLSVFALKPTATRFEHTTPVTAMTCSNGTSNVDCSGSGGLVTSAVLTVSGLTGGSEYQVYANLNAVAPQLTDGTGNPLSWSYAAADVTGS
jgi:hypothetical protein